MSKARTCRSRASHSASMKTGLIASSLATDGVPEVGRHQPGDIAAITVDVGLAHPVGHRLGHIPPDLRHGVVEVDDVVPVPPRGRGELALPVAGIPPAGDRSRWLSHAVWFATQSRMAIQAQRMRLRDKGLQIVQRPGVQRIDREVVAHGIRGAEGALRLTSPIGLIGISHTIVTPRSRSRGSSQAAAARVPGAELPRIDSIDRRAATPLRVGQLDARAG